MNAKQAKKLRKAAHKLTMGKPWAAYQSNGASRASNHGYGHPGTIRLDPECGKGVYRALKRAAVK